MKAFLPKLEQAESELKERLQTEPPESVDIETVTEGEPCIEMVSTHNVLAIDSQSSPALIPKLWPYTVL